MVIRKYDAGSRKREVAWRHVPSEVVGAKSIPYEDDDSSRSWSFLLLLRSQTCCRYEQNEGESAEKKKQPPCHGSPPGQRCDGNE
jgi:hypothetical protein